MASKNAKDNSQAREHQYRVQNRKKIGQVLKALRGIEKIAPSLAAELGTTLFCWPGPRKKIKKTDLPVELRPRLIKTPSGSIRVFESVSPQRQGRVLLAHGWAGYPMQFKNLIRKLCKEGYGVVVYDQHAHGETKGVLSSLPDFMQTFEEVMNEFPDTEHLIGHSFGGLALLCSVSGNKMMQKQVKSIVTIAAPQSPEELTKDFVMQFGFREKSVDTFGKIISRRKKVDFFSFTPKKYGPQLGMPILVLHDEEDPDVPVEHAKAISKSLKNKTLKISKGLGHHKILRDAEVIEQILNFFQTSRL
jgi:pimeloyl-ACP methyl ester carboxylesterase